MSSSHAFFSVLILTLSGCSTIGDNDVEPGSASPPEAGAATSNLRRGAGWHEFRGALRDGVVAGIPEPDKLPGDCWEESWRVKVGLGLSGVIAADGKVFCHARRETVEVVSCHSAQTGEVIWSRENPIEIWGQPWWAFGITDGPLATPSYIGGRLYTVGIHGLVQCFDAESGRTVFELSAKMLGSTASEYKYGYASSPLVRDGVLYVALSAKESGSLVALDAESGELRWRALNETVSYTSPVYSRIHGVDQLVVRTWQRVVGIDPLSGRVLWEHEAVAEGMRRDCATPLVVGDVIYLSSEFHGTIAVRVSRLDDGTWAVDRLFRTGALAASTMSPVYAHGHLFGLHKKRRFVCVDAMTGKQKWSARDFGYYLSVISFGDRAWALDNEGRLVWMELSPDEHRVLASWQVGEYTWAHVGVDENAIYFRDAEDLVCLRL